MDESTVLRFRHKAQHNTKFLYCAVCPFPGIVTLTSYAKELKLVFKKKNCKDGELFTNQLRRAEVGAQNARKFRHTKGLKIENFGFIN